MITKWEIIKKRHSFKDASLEELEEMTKEELEKHRAEYHKVRLELEDYTRRQIVEFLENQNIIDYPLHYKEDLGYIEFPRYLNKPLAQEEWLGLITQFIKLMRNIGYDDYEISSDCVNIQFPHLRREFIKEWNMKHPEHPLR